MTANKESKYNRSCNKYWDMLARIMSPVFPE